MVKRFILLLCQWFIYLSVANANLNHVSTKDCNLATHCSVLVHLCLRKTHLFSRLVSRVKGSIQTVTEAKRKGLGAGPPPTLTTLNWLGLLWLGLWWWNNYFTWRYVYSDSTDSSSSTQFCFTFDCPASDSKCFFLQSWAVLSIYYSNYSGHVTTALCTSIVDFLVPFVA